MTLAGPFDNMTGADFLAEMSRGVPLSELEAILDADARQDLELAREQYALAAVVATMTGVGQYEPAAVDAARSLLEAEDAGELYRPARDALNRLLADPYAALWKEHHDGAIAIKRKVRALRAVLHRACGE